MEQPSYKCVKFGKEKVSYHGAILWNTLPDHINAKDTFSYFTRLLNMLEGPRCSCTYCNSKLCHCILFICKCFKVCFLVI